MTWTLIDLSARYALGRSNLRVGFGTEARSSSTPRATIESILLRDQESGNGVDTCGWVCGLGRIPHSSVRFVVPGFLHVLALIAFGLLAILAPVIRLEAMAWFLRRRGVSNKDLRKWALAEAKQRPSALGEIIRLWRSR